MLSLFSSSINVTDKHACTYPGPVASAVVALQQAVNECAAAALDQRVRVTKLQQPAPEVTSSKSTGTTAYLQKRNSCSEDEDEDE